MANADCKQILNLIPLYLDDMLSDEEIDIVSRHINECSKCKQEYEFMKSMITHTKNLPEVDLPEGFRERVMARVAREARTKKARRYLFLRRIGAGVAAAAVLAFSLVAFQDFDNPDTKSEKLPTPSLSESPVSFTNDVNKQTKAPSVNERIRTFDYALDAAPVEESGKSVKANATSDAAAFTKAVVTVAENKKDEVLDILSSYEKDDIGYIVDDINAVLEKLSKFEVEISFEAAEDVESNYIVVK